MNGGTYVIKPCPACGMMPDIRPIDTKEISNGFVISDPQGRYSIIHGCTPTKDGRIAIYCHSVGLRGPFEVVDFWNTVRDEWKESVQRREERIRGG